LIGWNERRSESFGVHRCANNVGNVGERLLVSRGALLKDEVGGFLSPVPM
jgi:hypothetical protein